MIGTSLLDLAGIIISISLLRSVAPAGLLYICLSLYTRTVLVSPWLFLVAGLEGGFYFVYLARRSRLQKNLYNSPVLDRNQRQALFSQCCQQIPDVQNYPLGWFSSTRLKRENLVEWILWALFDCSPENAEESWNEEIDTYVKGFEELTGMNVEDGRVALTTSLRLSLDPVKMLHRPLVWYLIVGIVDLHTCIKLRSLGFNHYSSPRFVFPPRLSTVFSKPSVTEYFSSLDRDPIVFIHGLGIGLYPYVSLIEDLIQTDPDMGIILVEIMQISMHMTSKPVAPRLKTLDALYSVMNSLGISRAVLASHSYGTVITAHVLRDSRPIPKPLITSYLLIDPVCILLHLPNVAFNVLYREPRRANEWQLWYFASRDADIANTLSRYFFWAENILWKDDLIWSDIVNTNNGGGYQTARRKVAVILSGEDQIVPASEVRRYLTGEDEVKHRWSDGSMDVFYYPGLDHATVFDTRERRKGMLEILDKFTDHKVDTCA
ncbi:hypothetical protein BDP27DRAFT_1388250 [Rhodocollybia butyracea]|uniref:AB hydrolase-1 domain-containing protein n=1 Tax=Rhodocollybia butyracea TaxID=206335 RepID=A0A9P5Q4N8_9AGAR|nr:hypothetical protein BDP27DRAFT_1388250 [Rhodocollybia butyracea]